jgi:hypothetical protein
MMDVILLLLSCSLQGSEVHESIFDRTYMRAGKQVPLIKVYSNTHPRTKQVTEWVDWVAMDLQHKAYRQFFQQLKIPVYKSETRAEQEAIQKKIVYDFVACKVPVGAQVSELEAFFLENGFRSSRRASNLKPGTICLEAHHSVKEGFLDWNTLFAVQVYVHFDENGKTTSFQVVRAYFTYPHKGIFAD